MKQITCYSTCQGGGIYHYLNPYFPEDNFTLICNYHLVRDKKLNEYEDFKNILSYTNIFIYQEMPKKWGIYSTDISVEDNILSYLPHNCVKIVIPYIFADWYWGISKLLKRDATHDFNEINNETGDNVKYFNEEIIIDMKYNKKYDLYTILQLYDNDQIDFKYKERMEKGIYILKTKEQTCDIKVSDYILSNYKKQMLFYTNNHPSHYIYREMAKQILKKLNIDYSNFYKLTDDLDWPNRGKFVFSKYDKQFHNFEFSISCDDEYIKNIITEIYNLY
jgi:hypothetical protein